MSNSCHLCPCSLMKHQIKLFRNHDDTTTSGFKIRSEFHIHYHDNHLHTERHSITETLSDGKDDNSVRNHVLHSRQRRVQIRGPDVAINVVREKRMFFKSYPYIWSTYFTNCKTSRIVSETSISSLDTVYLRSTKETISTRSIEEISFATVFWFDPSADWILFHGPLKTEKIVWIKDISLSLDD